MRRMDITGQRFGRFIVVSFAVIKGGKSHWLCRCDCGIEKIVSGWNLKHPSSSHRTQSCGCLRRESVAKSRRKHGEAGVSAEYRTWVSLRGRCNCPTNKKYNDYGGRGIKALYPSFEAFLEDMGRRPSPGHSIDRRDNDGNYEPGNCRWATKKEQARNQRPKRLARTANVGVGL